MMVAVEACIKRYYRLYVEVPDGADNDLIKMTARKELEYIPLEELEKNADPDLEVEPMDVEWVTVDEGSIPALN